MASSLNCFSEYKKKAKRVEEEAIEAAKIMERVTDIKKAQNDPYQYR
jgi:hypothetical protein